MDKLAERTARRGSCAGRRSVRMAGCAAGLGRDLAGTAPTVLAQEPAPDLDALPAYLDAQIPAI